MPGLLFFFSFIAIHLTGIPCWIFLLLFSCLNQSARAAVHGRNFVVLAVLFRKFYLFIFFSSSSILDCFREQETPARQPRCRGVVIPVAGLAVHSAATAAAGEPTKPTPAARPG